MASHDGFLALAKPPGLSSAAAVGKVKRLLGLRRKDRIGHTGTLDPLATGVLVIALGSATRFIRYLPSDKEYELEVLFGRSTDTQDAEGETLAEAPVPADLPARVAAALPRFRDVIEQEAPAHSALKHQGKPLYSYARAGTPVPVKRRRVTISRIEAVDGWEPPRLRLQVACSAGTYMRSLARDLGEACACPAHMSALRRTRCNSLDLEHATSWEEDASDLPEPLPMDSLLEHLPRVDLNPTQHQALRQGQSVAASIAGTVRLYGPDAAFCGIGTAADGLLRPARLLPEEQS